MDKKEQYEKEALDAIEKHKLAFFSHIFAYVPFSHQTAYTHGLDKLDSIKDAIAKNRVSHKSYLLNDFITGDNATLKVVAYKLLADDDELARLNNKQEQAKEESPKIVVEHVHTTRTINESN